MKKCVTKAFKLEDGKRELYFCEDNFEETARIISFDHDINFFPGLL